MVNRKGGLPNSLKVLSEEGKRITPEAKHYSYSPNGGFDAVAGRIYGPEESQTKAKNKKYVRRANQIANQIANIK